MHMFGTCCQINKHVLYDTLVLYFWSHEQKIIHATTAGKIAPRKTQLKSDYATPSNSNPNIHGRNSIRDKQFNTPTPDDLNIVSCHLNSKIPAI